MAKLICIQDAANNIKPTPQQAQKHIACLKELLPEQEFCICEGYIGSWRMLPNGETCFYCPPCYDYD